MEKEFLDLFMLLSNKSNAYCVSLNYRSVTDWSLQITKRKAHGDDDVIISLQEVDRTLIFAKAYMLLADYMSEKYDGY